MQSKGDPKVYNITSIRNFLGPDLCTQLLFLHAFAGCDSTSRVNGVGKLYAFQKQVKGDSTLVVCANIFTSPDQTVATIESAGSQIPITLFSSKKSSLASLRYEMLTKKVVTSSTFVATERLPPTYSSTKFHSRRVYFQVMMWMDCARNLDPINWGWRLDDRWCP
jgi:hypothetical protein